MTLGIVLAALIALTVKASTRRAHPIPASASEAEGPTPPPEPTSPSVQPPAPSARRAAGSPLAHARGTAHLFGRVLPATDVDEEASFEDLTVTADDGARSFEARVLPDGRFSIHLPAGQYAVTAALGAQVGIAPSVAARPGAGRELTIQLALAAAIRGHVRGPDGAAISVRVSLAGHDTALQTIDTEDGDFTVEGLSPGHSYDLTFAGDDLRTFTLRSVTAPAEGIAAVIDGLPVLRGAIGFPFGGRCPIDRVALRALDAPPPTEEDDSDDDNVDGACQFQLPVPDGASQMLLVATGSGWYLEEPVTIPPLGDPEPVCLNPPCRANPREGMEKVRISLQGETAGGFTDDEGELQDEIVVQ